MNTLNFPLRISIDLLSELRREHDRLKSIVEDPCVLTCLRSRAARRMQMLCWEIEEFSRPTAFKETGDAAMPTEKH